MSDKTAGYYFVFSGRDLLCEEGRFQPLRGPAFMAIADECGPTYPIGSLDGAPCYAAELLAPLAGRGRAGLRILLGEAREELFRLAGRALQLLDWHRGHRFCGSCGAATRDEGERIFCMQCNLDFHPRISPSIIVLVRRGDEALLARSPGWPEGLYSTLAGFVEPGESVEETVHREVMEEVGLRVRGLRYLSSQNWPFPNSLMIGFHADYAGGEFRLQADEIADAGWFRKDSLPRVPPVGSISRYLIDAWLKGGAGL